MIITEVFFGVKCNRCQEICKDDEHAYWSDEDSAIEIAHESGWAEIKGKHYCIECHEINKDSGEIEVYEEFPEVLKTLNKFIDRICFGLDRRVFENERTFKVKFHLYKTPILKGFEHEFIKQLLGENLISIQYPEGKFATNKCEIEFSKPSK
ncbi:hypothetical protein [Flavobacterium capsici]|uniref:Uncharacterized protein n=1 Tax=Flavobacterium capsici TaxID=3075618 RepID=A0AA96EYM3_9FLAO|nr:MULTISPECIES: hypothetical protein [unclassified Flavobacterium]WNM19255.1 hypothetical protein RN608_00900 [Flavobacterium sp. PMR2A8]WNM20644.1 hypothetical protein RN605_08070 [Flavobacterium sp. PMTSA4]